MKIGIIGGGMMGLALAYRLTQKGHQVHVLEAENQLGGLSTWFDYGDFFWDKYYHVILKSDAYLLQLIRELGLEGSLHWTQTKTGFLWHGKHISMSNYWEFIQFPALSCLQKMRLACGILYSQYFSKPERLESLSAEKWLTSIFGKGVYQAIWEPLLESKFGVLKEQVPATIIASTLNRYYSTRNKGDGKEWLGHLKSVGLKTLFDTLEAKIKENGSEIECGVRVDDVSEINPEAIEVKCGDRLYRFDRLYSTIPTALFRKIAPNVKMYSASSKTPKFLGVIRLALVLKRPLSPYYVTNLIDKGLPFTGIIELSALTTPEELAGKKLVMIPRYDVPQSEWFQKSDEEIKEAFLLHLKRTWPNLEENILSSFVHREKVVQALWIESPPDVRDPAHNEDHRILSINAELAGRDTLNNNALVRVANEMADRLYGDGAG